MDAPTFTLPGDYDEVLVNGVLYRRAEEPARTSGTDAATRLAELLEDWEPTAQALRAETETLEHLGLTSDSTWRNHAPRLAEGFDILASAPLLALERHEPWLYLIRNAMPFEVVKQLLRPDDPKLLRLWASQLTHMSW